MTFKQGTKGNSLKNRKNFPGAIESLLDPSHKDYTSTLTRLFAIFGVNLIGNILKRVFQSGYGIMMLHGTQVKSKVDGLKFRKTRCA